jgi:hypothetical protein
MSEWLDGAGLKLEGCQRLKGKALTICIWTARQAEAGDRSVAA